MAVCRDPGTVGDQLFDEVAEGFRNCDRSAAEELRLACASVQSGPAIVAISGTGSVSKIALAVHFGHRVAAHYPNGQLYLDLRGFDPRHPPLEPAEALGKLLRSLGVAAASIPSDPDERAKLYRSLLSGQSVLVVLDNAASAGQVRQLLPGAASCLVVVTSRSRLGSLVARHDVEALTLGVLAPKDAVMLLARTVGTNRVAAEPDAAAELARACGGLPLALRVLPQVEPVGDVHGFGRSRP